MASLKRRLTVAASITLVATLGLTAVVLDAAFRDTSRALIEERLQAQAYAVLTAAEENASGTLGVTDAPPDPRLATPGSGLYAQLATISGDVLWRSASLLGESIRFPAGAAPGVARFGPAADAQGDALFGIALRIDWELRSGTREAFVVQIAEYRKPYAERLATFRRHLGAWFSGAALVTLVVQFFVLNWGLAPLRRATGEIGEIRSGERARLDGQYSTELQPLTDSINRLIDTSEQRLRRYRDGLGNLAHTLKTPLAVLRSATTADGADLRSTIDEQVERMDRAVSYHLKRAAAGGSDVLGPPIPVARVAGALVAVLQRVHAERRLTITSQADPAARFHGDEGDLTEMLGNLMDNACKWAAAEVSVRATCGTDGTLTIDVCDDGPGMDAHTARALVERGARADPDVPGHGIGLAFVHELVTEVYGGRIDFLARTDSTPFTVRIALGGHPAVE